MERRTLGRTGLEVTAIGFGAMTIGGAFGPVDDDESNRALHVAIDAGMNFIDTSDAYGVGHSETVIGKFLTERSDRGEILIFTKGGNDMATGRAQFHARLYCRLSGGKPQTPGGRCDRLLSAS